RRHVIACLVILFPSSCSATAPTEIYPLSLHDALPISFLHPFLGRGRPARHPGLRPALLLELRLRRAPALPAPQPRRARSSIICRSEEHTSELQSRENLVCRLLLEKKKEQTDTGMVVIR